MKPNHMLKYLQTTLEFPADNEYVLDRIGDRTIDAPDENDSRTVAELLNRTHPETYGSADELFEFLLSSLPDDYIGRKYYDDRGSNPGYGKGPSDRKDTSF